MALGRIKRSKAKQIARGAGGNRRGPTISTTIKREYGGTYWANACISPRGYARVRTPAQKRAGVCAGYFGRTPQAALAKAIKKLAGAIARRGRR